MSLRLLTDIAPIVSASEAKAHLRVFHSDDDAYIDGLIAAATDWLAGEGSWLGRAVVTAGWELTIKGFPSGKIELPRPPLASVEGVFYSPADGSSEVELSGYRVVGAGSKDGASLYPVFGQAWPDATREDGSVRIEFTAGYEDTPSSVKHAALLLIGHWYENREAASEIKIETLPLAVDALLMPYRSWTA